MLPEASRRGPGPKARQKPGDDRGGAPVLSPPESNVERGLCFFGGGKGGSESTPRFCNKQRASTVAGRGEERYGRSAQRAAIVHARRAVARAVRRQPRRKPFVGADSMSLRNGSCTPQLTCSKIFLKQRCKVRLILAPI